MVKLTILHTNDLHGRVQQLLRIATLVRQIRGEVEAKGGYCLYLDAGDTEDTSNLESSLTKGSALEAMVRGAGCEYLALGNAIPIRYGPEAIENLANHFGKPLLCGNLFDPRGILVKGLTPYFLPSFGDLKIGLIGLTDPMPVYRTVFKLDARKPVDVLPDLIEEVRSQGANLVVLLSHLGSTVDQQLAGEIPGLDLIIGGHDHKILYPPLEIDRTIIAQAGEHGRFLGRLDLEIDGETGKIVRYNGELIAVEEDIPVDPLALQSRRERAREGGRDHAHADRVFEERRRVLRGKRMQRGEPAGRCPFRQDERSADCFSPCRSLDNRSGRRGSDPGRTLCRKPVHCKPCPRGVERETNQNVSSRSA